MSLVTINYYIITFKCSWRDIGPGVTPHLGLTRMLVRFIMSANNPKLNLNTAKKLFIFCFQIPTHTNLYGQQDERTDIKEKTRKENCAIITGWVCMYSHFSCNNRSHSHCQCLPTKSAIVFAFWMQIFFHKCSFVSTSNTYLVWVKIEQTSSFI